jgi:antitoxin component YwqK of YwqJK toxin-antitoxin module
MKNGKFEGEGKLVYPNGTYYIGQFKNGIENGKCKIFYSNGSLRYEGDTVNK